MCILRYFVDMYDYDERTSHYDRVTNPLHWTLTGDSGGLYSSFGGRVYLLGCFN